MPDEERAGGTRGQGDKGNSGPPQGGDKGRRGQGVLMSMSNYVKKYSFCYKF